MFLFFNNLPSSELTFKEDELASIHQALVLGIKDYAKKTGFKKVLLGLSGGIDSSLTCLLAVQALGKENVYGILMPSPYSSPNSVTDAKNLAKNLGIEHKTIPIGELFSSYKKSLNKHFEGTDEDVTEEKRIRHKTSQLWRNNYQLLLHVRLWSLSVLLQSALEKGVY